MIHLELNALRLEVSGTALEKDVLSAVSSSGIAALCYAYKSRVKPGSKLIEKVQRKIKEKPEYTIEKITDVIGLRLITLFRNEISNVLRQVILLLKHENAINPNPFEANSLEEVIIYTSGSPHDPLLTELKVVLTEKKVAFDVVTSKEGYSSVHIVARLNGKAKLRADNSSEADHRLSVEIQLRSVFEDAWGEIDHKFGYILRAGKGDENIIYNGPLVQPHLKVLKQFTDACAQYADTIYTSAHTPLAIKDGSGKIASMPSDDEVLRRFELLGIPDVFSKKYVEGRGLRENALNLIRKDRISGQAACLKAASFFLSLHDEARGELNDTKGKTLYLFYTQMNEALCLLSTDSPQHVKTAELMYLKIRETYENFVLVSFRLAQAKARLGDIDESIRLFAATRDAIADGFQKYNASNDWPDELPKTDFRHMEALLPKLMGYQHWKKAQMENDNAVKMELFLRAHDITKEKIDPIEKVKISNNLVYYAMEYLSLAKGEPTPVTKRLATSLHTNLAVLEKDLRLSSDQSDISALDTMMEAYNFLGRIDLAQTMAKKILESAKNAPEGDPEETLSIIRRALRIQSLQGASQTANTA